MIQPGRKYSLATIAAELGVSKAAVSLAVNGKGRQAGLNAESERRILEFCRQVNYQPNIHAQRMNRRLVKNIGLLLFHSPEVGAANPFSEYNTAEIVGGVSQAATPAGYRFTVQLYRPDMDAADIFNWFRSREIDGLIYYGFKLPPDWVEVFRAEKRLAVGIGTDPADDLPCVNIDNFAMAAGLAEHLIGQGVRQFFYLGGIPTSYVARQRHAGFRQTLEKHRIDFPADRCIYCHFNEELARQTALRLIEEGKLTTGCAVVCANDAMAIGVHRALKERGLDVPGTVKLTGGDNIPLGRYLEPPLTTFDYLAFQQGEAAFNLLRQLIATEDPGPAGVMLQSRVIIRASA